MFASNLGAKNTMRSSNERCPSLPMALILGLVTFFEPSMALMNLASPIACGQSKIIERPRHMRIIGGKPSAHGQFPWTVRNDANMHISDFECQWKRKVLMANYIASLNMEVVISIAH